MAFFLHKALAASIYIVHRCIYIYLYIHLAQQQELLQHLYIYSYPTEVVLVSIVVQSNLLFWSLLKRQCDHGLTSKELQILFGNGHFVSFYHVRLDFEKISHQFFFMVRVSLFKSIDNYSEKMTAKNLEIETCGQVEFSILSSKKYR